MLGRGQLVKNVREVLSEVGFGDELGHHKVCRRAALSLMAKIKELPSGSRSLGLYQTVEYIELDYHA
jgi:hypothetical protein